MSIYKRRFILSYIGLGICLYILKWLLALHFNYPWGGWSTFNSSVIVLNVIILFLTLVIILLFEVRPLLTTIIYLILSFIALDLVMDVASNNLVEPVEGWHDDYRPEGFAKLVHGTFYYILLISWCDFIRFLLLLKRKIKSKIKN